MRTVRKQSQVGAQGEVAGGEEPLACRGHGGQGGAVNAGPLALQLQLLPRGSIRPSMAHNFGFSKRSLASLNI